MGPSIHQRGLCVGRSRGCQAWPGPVLPEGSEVPKSRALTSFELLTFIFKGPSQRLSRIFPSQRDLVSPLVSKLHSRSRPSSPAPSACRSGSPRKDSFSLFLGLKAETPQGHEGPCTSSLCCLLRTPRPRKEKVGSVPLYLCPGIHTQIGCDLCS